MHCKHAHQTCKFHPSRRSMKTSAQRRVEQSHSAEQQQTLPAGASESARLHKINLLSRMSASSLARRYTNTRIFFRGGPLHSCLLHIRFPHLNDPSAYWPKGSGLRLSSSFVIFPFLSQPHLEALASVSFHFCKRDDILLLFSCLVDGVGGMDLMVLMSFSSSLSSRRRSE